MTEGPIPDRVLITRPAEDAKSLIPPLAARGLETLIEPLLDIRLVEGPPPDLNGVQGLLFTSANGVRAFCARSADRSLPVFAVGDATAGEAIARGFADVKSAAGDVSALGRLVRARCDSAAGALFHPAASATAGDLGGDLAAAGFQYRRSVFYEAIRAKALSAPCVSAFREAKIGFVLFFSPRTAKSFVSLAKHAEIEKYLGDVMAMCLSNAVKREAEALPWRACPVAGEPTQQSLLTALDTARAEPNREKT